MKSFSFLNKGCKNSSARVLILFCLLLYKNVGILRILEIILEEFLEVLSHLLTTLRYRVFRIHTISKRNGHYIINGKYLKIKREMKSKVSRW